MSALTNSSCNFFSSQSSLLTFQRNLVLKGTFYKSFIDFGSRTYDSNVKNEVKFPSLRDGFGRSRRFVTSASLVGSSQIASNIFTLGTTIVIPFYTLMVIAPKSELTKRSVNSKIPYIILGALYAYLLYCSWTPETLRLMFASKYWLPELPGITRMFSNEVTVASAWLHLLAVDLFAARQVFQDGLKDGIETRHSIVLCLLFCPVGIMSHMLTKALENLHRRFKKDGNIRAASLSIFQH